MRTRLPQFEFSHTIKISQNLHGFTNRAKIDYPLEWQETLFTKTTTSRGTKAYCLIAKDSFTIIFSNGREIQTLFIDIFTSELGWVVTSKEVVFIVSFILCIEKSSGFLLHNPRINHKSGILRWRWALQMPPLLKFKKQKDPYVQYRNRVRGRRETWNLCSYLQRPSFYRPQWSCSQGNIFVPFCHSVHRGGWYPRRHWGRTPRKQTPQSRHPLEQTPPRADTPQEQTPPTPWEQTPSRSRIPPGADIPPLEADSGRTPREQTPL